MTLESLLLVLEVWAQLLGSKAVWQCMSKPKGKIPFDFHGHEAQAQRHGLRLGTKNQCECFVLVQEINIHLLISI